MLPCSLTRAPSLICWLLLAASVPVGPGCSTKGVDASKEAPAGVAPPTAAPTAAPSASPSALVSPSVAENPSTAPTQTASPTQTADPADSGNPASTSSGALPTAVTSSAETAPSAPVPTPSVASSSASSAPELEPPGGACNQPGTLLCEDFETGSVGVAPGAPWSVSVNGTDGVVEIDDTTPAHSGNRSVRVSSRGNYQTFLTLDGAPVFPLVGPSLYVRTYLRLDAPMTAGHNTYFKAGAGGAISSNNETRVGVMLEMLMINQPDGDRGFLSNESYWTDQELGAVVPELAWTCLEAFFDPSTSTVAVWMDGTEIPDLRRTDWKQDPLGALHFGFEKYAGPDADVWYDDIVVSTSPIGCD
jgi:hypothetical protein